MIAAVFFTLLLNQDFSIFPVNQRSGLQLFKFFLIVYQHHTAYYLIMAADVFCCAVHHDMRTEFERTQQVRCGKSIVDSDE